MRTRVAVVGGGQNGEHDVSVASAAAVAGALDPTAYEVVALTIARDGSWLDADRQPIGLAGATRELAGCDVVFPVVHGARGEDGALAALCELAGLRYVGSGIRSGALAMDKWVTKLVARAVGIDVAPGDLVTADQASGAEWTRPVVVKPVSAGSSLGVSRVDRPEALRPALEAAFALDDRVLVEEVVVGREVDVAVLRQADGSLVVPPALEIVADGIFDHATKYGGSADFRVPAHLSDDDAAALAEAAVAMFEALGCAGLARMDFFLTGTGPVLNEVNTMPGLTEHSQAPRMFAAAGIAYSELLDRLVQSAAR